MNEKSGKAGLVEEMKHFGSIEPISWMRECMEPIEKEIDRLMNWDIHHIRFGDIESFKKDIEKYSEEHPDAKVMATGFMFSSDEPEKIKEYKYKKEK